MLPGQVPGQVDIAGGWIEPQSRKRTGVRVQRTAPAAWPSC
jgi:hypothetical protein